MTSFYAATDRRRKGRFFVYTKRKGDRIMETAIKEKGDLVMKNRIEEMDMSQVADIYGENVFSMKNMRNYL